MPNQTTTTTITTTTLPNATVNVTYSQTLVATGGTTPYSWSTTADTLPTGLSLNSITGVISGTPTTAETANFTVQVADSESPANTDTQALSITVDTAADTPHSVDTDNDWAISQSEVNSFIAAYNSNSNTVTTANGDITANRITMREVLRVIYLYNGGGAYKGGQATVDTYDVDGPQSDPAPKPAVVEMSKVVGGITTTVTNAANNGVGSFRNAIANAAHGDTITFDGSIEKITLESKILIDKSLNIDGDGVTIISGDAKTRIFQVYNEEEDIFVLLLNMGIVDAKNSKDEFGGAVYNNGEDLTVKNCLFNRNANLADNGQGGAIHTSGKLTINNCVFHNNTASEEDDVFSTNHEVFTE